IDTRLQRLAAIGVRSVLVEPFDPQFAAMSPEDFARDLLEAKLQAVHVVIGEDFTFGHRGAGDVALLRRVGAVEGFWVPPIRKVEVGGVAVSSTRVRELVRAGAVRAAAELLGHPFSLVGRVIRGAGRGSTIGIPTANLDPHTELTPGRGVYAAFAEGPFG